MYITCRDVIYIYIKVTHLSVFTLNFKKARYLVEATVNYKTSLLDSKLLPSEVSTLGLDRFCASFSIVSVGHSNLCQGELPSGCHGFLWGFHPL